MNYPLVSVITASTGRPELMRCIESVHKQTYPNIQHVIFADGPEASTKVTNIRYQTSIKGSDINVNVIPLPFSVGKDRWNGHRMYGAGTYLADGEFVIFLDDDNTLDSEHVQNCFDALTYQNPISNQWSYSLRKIVTVEGEYLCNDDCESLGNWASVINPNDFFIDVNCYFLPKLLAVQISPIWYRKFREPGQPEVDRMLCYSLRKIATGICTGKYTVNYAVASNANLSVKPEFFTQGNAIMTHRYNNNFPWRQ